MSSSTGNSRTDDVAPGAANADDAAVAARQERAAGRLLDDERLRGDLTDDEFQPLLDWALAAADRLAALTAGLSDAQAEQRIDAGLSALKEAVSAAGDAIAANAAQDADRLKTALADAGKAAKAGPLQGLLRRLSARQDLSGPEVAALIAKALGPVRIKELSELRRKPR